MKITAVTTIPVAMPWPEPAYSTAGAGTKWSWGRESRTTSRKPVRKLEYLLVRIDTDEGVFGIGEAATDIGFFGDTMEQVQSVIDLYLGPRLIDRDPRDREEILHQLDVRGNSCAKSAIDLALHDLVGKALGVPAYVLLGGKSRERIQVSVEIAGGPPESMAAACAECWRQGIRAFKPKIGGIPERDAERLAAIRAELGPEASIRADANQGYTPKEAIRLCRLAEQAGVGLELLEQPVKANDLVGMALVRQSVDVPIEADEAAYTLGDVMAIIRAGAADVINIKIAKAGGLYAAKKIAALAEAAGLRVVIGTAFGLGPKIAAKLHLAAATVMITDAVEFTEVTLHETLADEASVSNFMPPYADGTMAVPQTPGLGVELDEAALERYRPGAD